MARGNRNGGSFEAEAEVETEVSVDNSAVEPVVDQPVVASPVVEAEVEAEVETPKPAVIGPHYLVLESFNSFGEQFHPGDKLHGYETWPEGTVDRRVENKFIVFKAG